MSGMDESLAGEALPTSIRDVDALLAQLEEEEQDLSLRRRRLFDRIDRGTDVSDHLLEQEREVSEQRRALHRRIDALRAHREKLAGGGGPAAA